MTDTLKPYERCATRLESRGDAPPDRAYVDELVEGLQSTGVEASWHSAVDAVGRPLFPSKVIPNCHPQASFEAFRYLIDSLHAIGRPVISWYPLVMNRALLEQHPDWKIRFYPMEGVSGPPERERNYCCYNSPYGQLLPELAVEIVRDVGFDGLWFDGSTFANHDTSPTFAPGCKCGFCRGRFREDTGLVLPEKVDFANRTFRRWMLWRYDVLMDVWRRVTDAVRAAAPRAVVCFNNYRRRSHHGTFAWTTGIPLRPLDADIVMSGELDGFPHQADFQMKMHRAYGCRRGVESWWPLCDHGSTWVPDVEPLPAVQAALGAISAGGVACTGTGVPPRLAAGALKAMQEAAAPAMPYLGGEPVEYAAILCSGASQDFDAHDDPSVACDEWHGANELCRHAHVQSAVIFDDHLTARKLKEYPLVLLGNAVCMSKQHARSIEEFVEQGGCVIACHRAGELDELGFAHPQGVLDDLLGIGSRSVGAGRATLCLRDEALSAATGGQWVTFAGPAVLAEPVGEVEMLADLADCVPGQPFDWTEVRDRAGSSPDRLAGVWMRRVKQGCAVYCGINLFRSYLEAPTPHAMRFLRALMLRLATPEIMLDGPMCVTMNCRRQADGRWAVHLHNCPGSSYRYPAPPRANCLHTPGEVVAVHGITLHLSGARAVAAESGITRQTLEITKNGRAIAIPTLELHDVVLITFDDA